jgi:WD40 repeat protein
MYGVDIESRGGLSPRTRFDLGDYPQALQWKPDSSKIAVAAISGRIVLLGGESGQLIAEYSGHAAGTQAIAWHPSGSALWSGGQDGRVGEWRDAGGEPRAEHNLGKGWVDRLAWHPSGDILAASCGKVLYWMRACDSTWIPAAPHPATIADIAWSPDGSKIATASYNGVWLWSPCAEKPYRHLMWRGYSLTLAWDPTGTFIATGDQGNRVHFWRLRTGGESRMWGYPGKVTALAWDARGRWLATGGGPDVCVWDCSEPGPEGRDPVLCQLGLAKVTALAWSREQSLLAAGYADGKVVFWQPTRDVLPLAEIRGESAIVRLAWSPDEPALAIAHESGAIALL